MGCGCGVGIEKIYKEVKEKGTERFASDKEPK
jgi:hypothetical protein